MDSALLVPLSLAFGVVVGAGIVLIVMLAALRGQRAVNVLTPSVPDGVAEVLDVLESAGVVLDPSNTVLKASPAAFTYGLVAHQGLVHPELVTLVDRVRRFGDPISHDLSVARGPFGDAQIHLFVRVVRLGSRYVLLLAEDRTESVRLEDMRRDFIANISHELKTPIGAIGLLAEALESASDQPERVNRFAKQLTREAERLARITREIIELSRLQAVDALISPELVVVDNVVAAAIDQNRVAAEAEHISIAIGKASGALVLGDESLLVVALHNLVSNAIHYSPPNSRIGIGISVVHEVVEIAVTDQGIGIPEEERERVFERFFRLDPARSRNTGGTGLGLSIVKHVVQNHGGDVRVWSQPGRGSTFTIRLPEAPSAAATTGVLQ
jgi:two-component system sensor histidine kinase SenX3